MGNSSGLKRVKVLPSMWSKNLPHWDPRSRCGVVVKPLALYPEVPSLIPSSSSLSDEALIGGPHLHMTLAIGGTSETLTLINTLSSLICTPNFPHHHMYMYWFKSYLVESLKILIAWVGNFINRTVFSDKESCGALSGSVYGCWKNRLKTVSFPFSTCMV